MRVLGVILFVACGIGAGLSISQALRQRRPRDLVFALLATVAAVVAVVGLVMAFVPQFLGS